MRGVVKSGAGVSRVVDRGRLARLGWLESLDARRARGPRSTGPRAVGRVLVGSRSSRVWWTAGVPPASGRSSRWTHGGPEARGPLVGEPVECAGGLRASRMWWTASRPARLPDRRDSSILREPIAHAARSLGSSADLSAFDFHGLGFDRSFRSPSPATGASPPLAGRAAVASGSQAAGSATPGGARLGGGDSLDRSEPAAALLAPRTLERCRHGGRRRHRSGRGLRARAAGADT